LFYINGFIGWSNIIKSNRISSLRAKVNISFQNSGCVVVQKTSFFNTVNLPTLCHRFCMILAVLLLASCAGNSNRAPVTDLSEGAGGSYRVRPGDTLYAIAWRYGFDYRQLAKTNNIAPPYHVAVGQNLLLKNPDQVTKRNTSTSQSVKNSRTNSTVSNSTTRSKNQNENIKASAYSSDRSNEMIAFSGRWRWPANGSVVKSYTTTGAPHKGIDIGGKLGESVYAAAGGEVVYAGNGLVGYGNLLILRHDDNYLSAYGHNSALLVREGDVVKAGQRIAEMGDSGTDSVKLHFEIRYDGKPVNPVGLLPKR
jgi:lipoprotein NlpD